MASGNVPDLPGDIVRCIAGLVTPECRPRMRAVCSAWSAAVPAETLPWIVLQPPTDEDEDDTAAAERSTSFSVLSLPIDSKLPLMRVAGPGRRARCFGAGHGWLALVAADLSVTLHNPVTGHVVSLPRLNTHPMVGDDGSMEDGLVLWRAWLDLSPEYGDFVPAEEFRDKYVRKVVFSARPGQDDGCFAVLLGGYHSHAAYARAGAAAWETLRDAGGHPVSLVHDVVHVEGSRFLAVTRCHGKVLELDLAAGGSATASVRVFAEPLALARSVGYFAPGTDMHVENHLVLVDGEIYQIWASREAERLPPEEDDPGKKKKLYQYRIADVGVVRWCDRGAASWEAAADLGDWAVLVGRSQTVAVRAGDVSGVLASCVYFIAGELEEVVSAFHLRSGRAAEVGGDVLRDACATPLPPVWFMPSLK